LLACSPGSNGCTSSKWVASDHWNGYLEPQYQTESHTGRDD
jgi:hypothetical protein